MKKTRTLKKKTAAPKGKTHSASHASKFSGAMDIQQPIQEAKKWGSSFSHRLLSNYAIPFTRLVEAKLVSLQHKI